ncbi:MAG TPA: DUF309 domain-containing protein [Longimicrobiales bacterium]|nr:DUF309 domain-containing protein [Longimicrobiales bacterium]
MNEDRRFDTRAARLHPDLIGFLNLFRDGRYWDSHEALERPWRENGSRFYKGLILYASAFVHAERGNDHGVRAQLGKARRHLQPFAPAYLGFDVEEILEHAHRCLEHLDAGGAPGSVPPPTLTWDRNRVRGSEPELKGYDG